MHDLVIRNGTIVDGSGLGSYPADVGIKGRRIVEIGRVRSKGSKEIDAEGHVVTPGFIDGHTHMDAQVFWDPMGTCSCWHGVTTVVMGNCGFTLAPCRSEARELVVKSLERAEDISATAMQAGIDWSWQTYPEYLDALERLPKGINYASNVGHSALRTWAMGERAFDGESDEDDIALMRRELETALRAGAMGFTTSRSNSHETSDDRPVASRLASWNEVCQLVDVMSELGAGIFELALESSMQGDDPKASADAERRLSELAITSHIPITFGVIPYRTAGMQHLDLIDNTVAAGGRMFGQSHSRGISVVLSFRSLLPFARLAEWRNVLSMPEPEKQRLLRDPDVRRRLVHAAKHGNYDTVAGTAGHEPDYDKVWIFNSATGANVLLKEAAVERGIDPVELMIDLAIETDLDQLFLQEVTRSDPNELIHFLKHPRSVMTFSDSGAHVSQIMDSSIQTHLLQYWVRDRQELTLEEAVRLITLGPALAWGFAGRGLVREGYFADLNVFNPNRVAPELPTLERDLPGGAVRLKQKAAGFLATIVGGRVVLNRGEETGELPGRLLRRHFPAG